MRKEDKKLQKHLVDEMMKVSETNPDVMLYMQALMENYEKLEQENKQLKEEKPYLYTNTEWEDILEYQGKSYIELDRFKTIEQENKQLKEELKSANEEITWWSNRFNAVERDNRQLKEDKKKAIELLDELNIKIKDILKIGIDIKEISDIREILGDKE